MLQQRDAGRIGGREYGLLVALVLPLQERLGADDIPGPDAGEQVGQGGRDVLRRRPSGRRSRHTSAINFAENLAVLPPGREGRGYLVNITNEGGGIARK